MALSFRAGPVFTGSLGCETSVVSYFTHSWALCQYFWQVGTYTTKKLRAITPVAHRMIGTMLYILSPDLPGSMVVVNCKIEHNTILGSKKISPSITVYMQVGHLILQRAQTKDICNTSAILRMTNLVVSSVIKFCDEGNCPRGR